MEEVEQEPGLQALREQHRELSNLAKSEGWALYLEVLREQIETRKNDICFSEVDSVFMVLQQEYRKGEVSGIYMAQNLMDQMIEDLGAAIKRLESKMPLEENENGTES